MTTHSVKQEEFIQLYLTMHSGYLKLKGDVEHKIMYFMWRDAVQRTNDPVNRVIINKAVKEEWVELTGFKIQSINNAINSLVKKELLISEKRTMYILNPRYFFKGALADRIKAIDIVFKYKVEDKPWQTPQSFS